ncbi:coatomer subunit zeta-2 isoform X2 [Dromaius novaehollandiae]|uniref:coatomer subunit zeta-2 isoform X2 n=1 Tax=Dromaius novaehollandiae TaxID=8790 RepID=UPI00311DA6EF
MEPAGLPALFILDSDGQRLLAKYYDSTFPSAEEQAAFERRVFSSTRGVGGDVACLQGLTVVCTSSADLSFYVVGSGRENELLLSAVLGCLVEALGRVLRGEVEKRWLLDNLAGAFLVVDEIVDGGRPRSRRPTASSSWITWWAAQHGRSPSRRWRGAAGGSRSGVPPGLLALPLPAAPGRGPVPPGGDGVEHETKR